MKRVAFPFLVLALAINFVGCSDDKQAMQTSNESTNETKESQNDDPNLSPSERLIGNEEAKRKTLDGKWLFVLAQNSSAIDSFIVDVTRLAAGDEQGEFKFEVVEASRQAPPLTLESHRVKDEVLQLTFHGENNTHAVYDGKLIDGVVWGNLQFDNGRCIPGFLKPTDVTTLANRENVDEIAGYTDLFEMQTIADVLKHIRANSHSPLVAEALLYAVRIAVKKETPEAEFADLAKESFEIAEKWGPRIEFLMRLQTALSMTANSYLPDTASQILEKAQKLVASDETLKRYAPAVEHARVEVQQEQAAALTRSDDEQKQNQGEKELLEIQKKQPFDAKIILTLAELAEKRGKDDAAMELYATLIALPQMEMRLMQDWHKRGIKGTSPSESLKRLWEKSHKDMKGAQQFLEKIYEAKVFGFVDKDKDQTKIDDLKGNQTILFEAFTGAHCGPCLAADLALAAASRKYPLKRMIVLRFHQHSVGPDPMTNTDSESRAVNYGVEETPAIFLNGIRFHEFKGFLEHVEDLYTELCTHIDEELATSTPVTIDLKAKPSDTQVEVEVEATGIEQITDKHRLCLALAEDSILFRGGNGIMHHEMVVRKMIGGPEGITAVDNRLTYSGTISIDKIRRELRKYLDEFEAGEGYAFPTKPMEFKKFHLVAYVQDTSLSKDREKNVILQATSVPITFEESADAEKKPGKDKTKEAAASQ